MKFVLLGGGENGHNNTTYETEPFDREIIRLTGKTTPSFLFIGAANLYPDYYYEVMKGIYGERLGCETEHLTVADIKDHQLAKAKIEAADIIYVGGGNTLKMMKLFRKYKTDELLRNAAEQNKVLCGVSAGAICWCKFGQSDARPGKSTCVTGLGLIDLVFCPHILTQPQRGELLKAILRKKKCIAGVAFDYAALEIVDDRFRVLTLEGDSKAELCFFENGTYVTRDIGGEVWRPLSALSLRKKSESSYNE